MISPKSYALKKKKQTNCIPTEEHFHTIKKNLYKMKKSNQPPIGWKVRWVCINLREEVNSRPEELH